MEDRLLTQADVARKSGLSRTTISSVLRGQTGSVETFKAVAKALKVRPKAICECHRQAPQSA